MCISAQSVLRVKGYSQPHRSKQLLTARARTPSSHLRKRLIVQAYTVTLDTPDGQKTIQCDGDTYILDAADEAGLDLPYSCRSGSCGTCAAKAEDISQIDQVRDMGSIFRSRVMQQGSSLLPQDDNSYLEDGMLEKGYFLTCTSYPKADVTVKTDQEDNVFN